MSFVIVKRGKFLEGSNYCTGFKRDFFWTDKESEARRYADDDDNVFWVARETGGKAVKVANTAAELKALGKRKTAAREANKSGERK